jgi:hypothetical protein
MLGRQIQNRYCNRRQRNSGAGTVRLGQRTDHRTRSGSAKSPLAGRSRGGRVAFSNRITNVAEARRMFGSWADILRERLDRYYPSKTSEKSGDE